jgi:Pvc16 N-terminal domain
MNGNAIQLVSKAVQDLLQAELAREGIAGGVYVGPLDDPEASGAAAVLFLYRVAVNAELRNGGHLVPIADPSTPAPLHANALPLELFFLLTGGNTQTGGERDAGLLVLGIAIQALNDAPVLVGSSVQGETVRITLDSLTSEEMSRIWALFPTVNYRTSVAYRVTPVWIDPRVAQPSALPVTEQRTRAGTLLS